MTPEQCRAARGWLNWSQDDLANAGHVSLSTVRDFEKGRHVPIANNLAAMRVVLEAKGIVFVDGGGTYGITCAKPQKRAKRGRAGLFYLDAYPAFLK
jgi:ribosome-binding protein aMBF1 (putative translation factor)